MTTRPTVAGVAGQRTGAQLVLAAKRLVEDVARISARIEDAYARGYEAGNRDGQHDGYTDGYRDGFDSGADVGAARVLLELRAGWPDLRPAMRLVSRQYTDLLDGPGVAAPCTCACCRRSA